MNPTIKDVAKQAGVSYATVSRALNNKSVVKSETRKNILNIARELNYRPNAIARGLVKKRTYSIGLIIPDITNPFFPEVASGVEDRANESGYSVFLCNTNWERNREIRYIYLLFEKRVDGIIIAPVSNSKKVDCFKGVLNKDIPVVYLSNTPQDGEYNSVIIDNVRGAFLATKHLIESGYKEIGFIGAPDESLSIDERLEGYKLAFKEYGMEINNKYIKFGDFKQETGYKIIKRMITEGNYPNAILAENDLLALGVMQGVKDMGLIIPEDVAVVGFDDIRLASFPEIQLTTVYQPKYKIGKIAIEILLEEIEKKDEAKVNINTINKRIVLEPDLIIRKSS